ncbi:hypothetical protein [Sphingomonas faeni]|uniref:hypothetical protein n=1 Tax=Sphingomonas faeni TaxID=185950 RepID=UPI003358065E
MNDNNTWPVLGEAAASRVAKILAARAGWKLAEVAADHGMPLAGFLENEATALLIAVTRDPLQLAAAQMESALIAGRCDGLIIADERDPWFPPRMSLGHWQSGKVSWYLPMLPYEDRHDTLWLVPHNTVDINPGAPAFRLVARYLRPEPLPWRDDVERLAGLDRGATLLRRSIV